MVYLNLPQIMNLYLSYIFQIVRGQCWPPTFPLCIGDGTCYVLSQRVLLTSSCPSQCPLVSISPTCTMIDIMANIFSFLTGSDVKIKRELRYCAGFKCKSIYFIPEVISSGISSWLSIVLMTGQEQQLESGQPSQLDNMSGLWMLSLWSSWQVRTILWRQYCLGLSWLQNCINRWGGLSLSEGPSNIAWFTSSRDCGK